MNKEKIIITVSSLMILAALCGCGASGGRQVIEIGRDGLENIQDSRAMESGTVTAESEIRVYVCGAVEAPGVVSLPEGSRAEDALLAAGGFAETARRDYVNLAERVSDGQKLYFPTLEEDVSPVEQETAAGLVNINTADLTVLCTLPGIGESRAKDIIAYREKNGAFVSCEDIMKVPGIKTSVYSKIIDKITIK